MYTPFDTGKSLTCGRTKRRRLRHLVLPFLVLLGAVGCGPSVRRAPDRGSGDTLPQRIVSMSPAVTEMLFELGVGDRVVGVTTYCHYPEAARQRAKIGGFYDASYEAIYSLRPDLVVSVGAFHETNDDLEKLGLRHLSVDTGSIPGILQSIRLLGERCGAEVQGQAIVARIERRIAAIHAATEDTPALRVLVSVGRSMGTGQIEDLYVAGEATLYGEMIVLAGGVNAYTAKVPYARISREGLLRMNPDVVIDLVPDLDTNAQISSGDVRREWMQLTQLAAVKHERVHIFGGEYVCRPGPGICQVLLDIAGALNPRITEKIL